jgi:hypothetical protein
MTITDGISGYSIERGCDHWVRFEKKVDNTTAIVSLKAEEISRTKVLNASQAIQGKAAGVQVVSSDLPVLSVIIRGLGTALGGRTLYS